MLVKGYRCVCYTQIDKAMMPKHRGTLEIKVVHNRGGLELPPPPPAGLTMRQWFAGLALANAELMKDVPDNDRMTEAVRLADELVAALDPPRAPTLKSMRPPSKKELRVWEAKVKVENEASVRRGQNTVAPSSRSTHKDAIYPAPVSVDYTLDSSSLPSLPPPSPPRSPRELLPEDTTYSSITTHRIKK
jgi:hypothetical protein